MRISYEVNFAANEVVAPVKWGLTAKATVLSFATQHGPRYSQNKIFNGFKRLEFDGVAKLALWRMTHGTSDIPHWVTR